jgi:hypothetical protein
MPIANLVRLGSSCLRVAVRVCILGGGEEAKFPANWAVEDKWREATANLCRKKLQHG